MATYLSQPRQRTGFVAPFSLELMGSIAAQKQNNIDQNYLQMSQNVESLLGQNLARDIDREYMQGKLKNVLTTLQNTDSISFSSAKASAKFQNALTEVRNDDIILNSVANAKKIQGINELRNKKMEDGTFDPTNFNYALMKMGYNEYFQSDDLKATLGQFNYTDRVDRMAILQEQEDRLKDKFTYEQTITDPATGETRTYNMSELTEPEIQQYLKESLQNNAAYMKQAEIDGAMELGMTVEGVRQRQTEIISGYNSQIDSSIEKLQNQLQSATPKRKQQLQKAITTLTNQKREYAEGIKRYSTPEQLGSFLILDAQTAQSAKAAYTETYMGNKFSKQALKNAERINSAMGNIAQVNRASEQPGLVDLTDSKKLEVRREIEDYIETTKSELSNSLNSLYNSADPTTRKAWEQEMEEYKQWALTTEEGQKVHPNGVSNEVLQIQALQQVKSSVAPDKLNELISQIEEVDRIHKSEESLVDNYVKTSILKGMGDDTGAFNYDDNNFFGQVYNDEGQMMLIMPDKNGKFKGTTQREFLDKNGINTPEKFKSFIESDSELAQRYRANIGLQTIDMSMDYATEGRVAKAGWWNILPPVYGFNSIMSAVDGISDSNERSTVDISKKEYDIIKASVKRLTGEELEATYDLERDGDNYRLKWNGQDTKTRELLLETQKATSQGSLNPFKSTPNSSGSLSSSFGGTSDATIYNESSLMTYFDDDSYNRAWENVLGEGKMSMSGVNMVKFAGNANPEKNTAAYKEILTNYSGDLDDKLDIYTRVMPNGDIEVFQQESITTIKETTDEDGEDIKQTATKKVSKRAGVISKSNLKNMPTFTSIVSTERAKTETKSIDEITPIVENINFINSNQNPTVEGREYNDKMMTSLGNLYDQYGERGILFKRLAIREEAPEVVLEPHLNELMQTQKGLEIVDMYEDMLEDTTSYSVTASKNLIGQGSKLGIMKGDQLIGTIPVNEDQLPEALLKAYRATPQVLLGMYTMNKIREYKEELVAEKARQQYGY